MNDKENKEIIEQVKIELIKKYNDKGLSQEEIVQILQILDEVGPLLLNTRDLYRELKNGGLDERFRN